MKRFFQLMIVSAVVLAMAGITWAASSQTISYKRVGETYRTVTIAWTAHTDGSYESYDFPSAAMAFIRDHDLCAVVTNPGTTKPQDNYDIYLKYDGVDLLGAAGENRDQDNTEIAYPIITATYQKGCVPVPGQLQFVLSGNNVNTAIGTAEFIFKRVYK